MNSISLIALSYICSSLYLKSNPSRACCNWYDTFVRIFLIARFSNSKDSISDWISSRSIRNNCNSIRQFKCHRYDSRSARDVVDRNLLDCITDIGLLASTGAPCFFIVELVFVLAIFASVLIFGSSDRNEPVVDRCSYAVNIIDKFVSRFVSSSKEFGEIE